VLVALGKRSALPLGFQDFLNCLLCYNATANLLAQLLTVLWRHGTPGGVLALILGSIGRGFLQSTLLGPTVHRDKRDPDSSGKLGVGSVRIVAKILIVH